MAEAYNDSLANQPIVIDNGSGVVRFDIASAVRNDFFLFGLISTLLQVFSRLDLRE